MSVDNKLVKSAAPVTNILTSNGGATSLVLVAVYLIHLMTFLFGFTSYPSVQPLAVNINHSKLAASRYNVSINVVE
jgi:hypothetical protein